MAGYEGRYRETVKGFGGDEGRPAEGARSLAETIQSVEGDLMTFRGCVQSIGTQFDDPQNRAELKRLRGTIKDKLTGAQRELKGLRKNGEPAHKVIVDRQARQLEGHMTTFTELLEREKRATKQNPLGSGATSPYDTSSSAPSPDAASMTTQTQMTALTVREREVAELQDLERDIVDLHAIQTDIAQLVNEQGDDIDRIEVRTEQAQGRVEHGLEQTEKAVELKKKNLKLKLIVAGVIIGVFVTLAVIIIIVIAVVVPRSQS